MWDPGLVAIESIDCPYAQRQLNAQHLPHALVDPRGDLQMEA
jgi:hypothetical protein